jgi:hypothetical protein
MLLFVYLEGEEDIYTQFSGLIACSQVSCIKPAAD